MAESSPRIFEASGGVWAQLRVEAVQAGAEEPLLASYLHATILHHDKAEDALAYHLAQKLGHGDLPALQLREVSRSTTQSRIWRRWRKDMRVVRERDPPAKPTSSLFLFFKGYGGLQVIASPIGSGSRIATFSLIICKRISELFAVDIHPAAVARACLSIMRTASSSAKPPWWMMMSRCSIPLRSAAPAKAAAIAIRRSGAG